MGRAVLSKIPCRTAAATQYRIECRSACLQRCHLALHRPTPLVLVSPCRSCRMMLRRRRRDTGCPNKVHASAESATSVGSSEVKSEGLQSAAAVVGMLAVGMASCSVTRATVPVLAVPVFVEQFGYTPAMMGLLQSSILLGYFVGQVPAGFVADKMGGDRLMLLGMICWSFGTLAVPLATATANPLPLLIGARFLMGFTQAVIMPSVASAAAKWVPVSHRSRALSVVYTGFHLGTVAGYVLTPLLATYISWQNVFVLFGLLGIVAGFKGLQVLGGLRQPSRSRPSRGGEPGERSHDDRDRPVITRRLTGMEGLRCRWGAMLQMLVLIWTHSAIGWGFFILQSWTPTFMSSLGYTDPKFMGLISGLPWLICAVASLNSGTLADTLLERGVARPTVRRLMQGLATIGPSLFLVPLFLPGLVVQPAVQVACIAGLLVMQTFSYSGFQSYLQDVAPSDAGKIISITNSFGILIGVAGNLLTGIILERSNDYRAIFFITAVFYTTSFIAWVFAMKGQKFRIADIISPVATSVAPRQGVPEDWGDENEPNGSVKARAT